ncbi:MAG: CRISPR-associated endonuclease Cas3'' [Firmicutes bacterium]|nr:CRISPR-associated endonuclease Cas3'' [Bacillota bacterium]
MTEDRIYRLLPGKSGDGGAHLPLWMHLEDTAHAAEYLCNCRTADSVIHACGMTREEFGKICVFLAMVHDIGKCTPLFEARILQAIPQRRDVLGGAGLDIPDISAFIYDTPRHAGAGQEILKDFGCRYGVCAVVGAHHGKPVSEKDDMAEPLAVYPKNFYAKQRDLWRGMQRAVLDNALARAGYAAIEELPVLSNCAQMLLCGMLIQADWIASNTAYFPLLSEDEEGKPDDCPVRGARAFAALSLPGVWNADYEWHGSESFYALRFGFSPNSMQRLTAEAARSMPEGGLMIVEAQMGTGKTEAAMAAAEILSKSAGCGGVFFGLPTQATSNGIFSRVAGWAEKISQNSTHTIRLVHGMAELNTDYRAYFPSGKNTDCEGNGGLEAHSWFAGRKQALLADFVVGTVDSALMAALSQKHVMLRHLGLCGKTVIIDECHAYDAYMSRFLLRMLRWLGAYRVPVILLSATLPRERKEEMLREYINGRRTGTDEFEIITFPQDTGYPMITWTEGDKVLARAA